MLQEVEIDNEYTKCSPTGVVLILQQGFHLDSRDGQLTIHLKSFMIMYSSSNSDLRAL